jgi:hypothetical protein
VNIADSVVADQQLTQPFPSTVVQRSCIAPWHREHNVPPLNELSVKDVACLLLLFPQGPQVQVQCKFPTMDHASECVCQDNTYWSVAQESSSCITHRSQAGSGGVERLSTLTVYVTGASPCCLVQEIPIPGKVAPGFEVLRFVKKTQQLRVEMALLGPQQGARPTPAASADANGSGHAAGTPAGKAHAHQSEPPRAYQDPAANHVAANGHAAQFSWAAHDDAAAHLRRQTNSRHKSEGTGEPRQQPSYTASAGEHYNGAQRESYGNGTPPQAGARHAGHRESHLDQEQEEQLYESARAQANREAAAQWAARAEEATAAGDLARAVRLLSKVRLGICTRCWG